MNRNQRGIIAQIENIIKRIEKTPHREHYVCVHAITEPYEHEIMEMVRQHIGCSFTMQAFLAGQWGLDDHKVSTKVANSYRIVMLRNMIKMVEKGAYQ